MGVFNKSEHITNETTVISSNAFFKGDLEISSNIHIDGEIEGNINSKSAISVGKNGKVKGDIKGDKVVISGDVEGKIECNELEILKGGSVKGEVLVKNLIIQKGGNFEGNCKKKDSATSTQ